MLALLSLGTLSPACGSSGNKTSCPRPSRAAGAAPSRLVWLSQGRGEPAFSRRPTRQWRSSSVIRADSAIRDCCLGRGPAVTPRCSLSTKQKTGPKARPRPSFRRPQAARSLSSCGRRARCHRFGDQAIVRVRLCEPRCTFGIAQGQVPLDVGANDFLEANSLASNDPVTRTCLRHAKPGPGSGRGPRLRLPAARPALSRSHPALGSLRR